MKIANLFIAVSVAIFVSGCYSNNSLYQRRANHSNRCEEEKKLSSYFSNRISRCSKSKLGSNSNLKRDTYLVKSYVKSNKNYNYTKKYIDLSQYRGYIQRKINEIRANGTPCSSPTYGINYDKYLSLSSSYHAKDMAINNFFSHKGSGKKEDVAKERYGVGSRFYERIIFFGYPLKGGKKTGEIITYTKFNIVGNSDVLAHFDHAIENFVKSPKHCRLLTSSKFNEFGVGAYRSNDKIYWVIDFAQN